MSNSKHNFTWSTIIRWLKVVIFLLAMTARLLLGSRNIDESIITFRYVRNILAGNGFAYNPGKHV